MPLYEYRCPSCGHEFETLQRTSESVPTCPRCGGVPSRKVSRSAFQLRGTGWYATDYRAPPAPTGGSDTGTSSSGSGGSGD